MASDAAVVLLDLQLLPLHLSSEAVRVLGELDVALAEVGDRPQVPLYNMLRLFLGVAPEPPNACPAYGFKLFGVLLPSPSPRQLPRRHIDFSLA